MRQSAYMHSVSQKTTTKHVHFMSFMTSNKVQTFPMKNSLNITLQE
jgi:hypothetical protein